MRMFVLAVILCASFASTVRADYPSGYQAYQTGDYPKAFQDWKAAANEGSIDAQAALGILYYKGWGVPQDYAAAGKWYRRAADQGHAVAQNNLGMMYQEGLGVEQDYVEAYLWFSLAAAHGTSEIQTLATENRDQIASRLTAADIERAQNRTRDWKPVRAK